LRGANAGAKAEADAARNASVATDVNFMVVDAEAETQMEGSAFRVPS